VLLKLLRTTEEDSRRITKHLTKAPGVCEDAQSSKKVSQEGSPRMRAVNWGGVPFMPRGRTRKLKGPEVVLGRPRAESSKRGKSGCPNKKPTLGA